MIFFSPGLNPVPTPTVIPPPPDIQPIIDKLAEFVAKNGDEFENSVRDKGDPRFDFLNSWHSFYPYYEQKKIIFRREAEERQQEQLNEQKGRTKELMNIDIDNDPRYRSCNVEAVSIYAEYSLFFRQTCGLRSLNFFSVCCNSGFLSL